MKLVLLIQVLPPLKALLAVETWTICGLETDQLAVHMVTFEVQQAVWRRQMV